MLFRISKTNSNNREVFPLEYIHGEWIVEYNENFPIEIEDDKLIVGRFLNGNKAIGYYKSFNLEKQEFNSYCKMLKGWEELENQKYFSFSKDGSFEIKDYVDTYIPPYTDNDLTTQDVAEIIHKDIVKTLHLYVEKYGELDLFLSGGLDTGLLYAVALNEKIPLKVHTQYKDAIYPLLQDWEHATPQHKFMAEYHQWYRQIPAIGKNILIGLCADGCAVSPPHAARTIYPFLGMDYDHELKKALDKNYYQTQQKVNKGYSNKKTYDTLINAQESLINAKWYWDQVHKMNGGQHCWNIDKRQILNVFMNRDYVWWQMALKPKDFNLNHHDKIVYKTIIKMTTPKILDQCHKKKQTSSRTPVRIPKRWIKEQKNGEFL